MVQQAPCSQPFRGAQCGPSCMDLVQTNPSWRGEGSSVRDLTTAPLLAQPGTAREPPSPRPARQRLGSIKHIPAVGIWACSCQSAASVWPWGRRAGAEQVCRRRPVGQFGSAASSWLLRATAVSRKCALGGWYLRGVERNFGTGVGVWVGAVLLCFVLRLRPRKPQNYQQSHPNPGLVSPVS